MRDAQKITQLETRVKKLESTVRQLQAQILKSKREQPKIEKYLLEQYQREVLAEWLENKSKDVTSEVEKLLELNECS